MKVKSGIVGQRGVVFKGRGIVKGVSEGTALITKQSFGFLGLLDPETGLVVDKRHGLYGERITGRVLGFPYGIGSTMGAIYLLDAVRCGNAPAAIINIETEPIIAAGAVMTEIFYGKCIPVVDKISEKAFDFIRTGDQVRVDGNKGLVEIIRRCATK